MAILSSILAWEIPWTEEPGGLQSGVAKSQTRLSDFAFHFQSICKQFWASLVARMVKNPPAVQETWVRSLVWEDPLEKGMATHSSILAWRIPWTEEPGGLQSMGSQESGTTEQLTLSLSLGQMASGSWSND